MFDDHAPDGHPLMQDPAFARAMALCGAPPLRLPDGSILLIRRFFGMAVGMLPRAVPPPDLAEQLRAQGWGRLPVVLSPERPCPLPRALPLAGPRQRAVVRLSRSASERRAQLHPKWRNQLRRAEKAGLQLRTSVLPPDPDGALLRREARQGRLQGYANWPAPLTASFARIAPDQTLLLQALSGGRVIAETLFLLHGKRASYHIGLTSPAGRACAAHNLLIWQAQERLAQRGICSLDLGLLHSRTPGLNRFKCRAGAEAVITGGTHVFWPPIARRGAQPQRAARAASSDGI